VLELLNPARLLGMNTVTEPRAQDPGAVYGPVCGASGVCGGGVMADRSGSEDRPTGGATATSARGGATAKVKDNGRGKNVSALAEFRLPWPQGFDVDPKRVLWLGGLAVLAAVEVLEWPVALVVGAGSYVAEWMARQDVEKIAAQRS
jgi:hypothetical protein